MEIQLTPNVLVLGCGDHPIDGAVNVDSRPLPKVDTLHDLNFVPWPLSDGRFDLIVAEHILEHMTDPIAFLKEIHRVSRPGADVVIEVPHWKHHLAHGMPDHRTTWAHNSFDPTYVTAGKLEKIRVEYRLGCGPRFHWIKWQRLGRVLCKYTGLVSGLRFYLRRLENPSFQEPMSW